MSYRSDYDHTLLSSVPGPTRAEKQEGYDVDLLEESRDRDRRAPSPPTNGAASDHHNGNALDYSPGAVSYARKEAPTTTAGNEYEPIRKRVPWYRTRKGIIGIVIAVLIIIAAAVGGGVGGTRHSSKSSNNSSDSSNGIGQASPTSSSSTQPSSSSILPGISEIGATSSAVPASSSNALGVSQAPGRPRRLGAARRFRGAA